MMEDVQKIKECEQIMLGEKLGEGAYREVWQCKLNKHLVVKLEKSDGEFSNIREWKIWQEVQFTPFEKWFAPCFSISNGGLILIQTKVRPARREELPEKIPYFFTDVKPENFGFIGDQLVCCDYGSIPISRLWSDKRMRKAKWEDHFTEVRT